MLERTPENTGPSGFEGGAVPLCENVEVKPDRKRVWLRPDLVLGDCQLVSEEVPPEGANFHKQVSLSKGWGREEQE